jgi:putative ABC transport system ATP-binding protein
MNNRENAAIFCNNIIKTFGEGNARVEALRGVSLTIHYGELRLLMGPSGSGKTTLISIMAGIMTQDSGECLVNGIDVNHLPDKERTHFRGQNIGFVFQSFKLLPIITVEENISIPLLINGVQKKEALDRSKQVLTELGMEDKIGSYPTQLSGGQQQRVAIARALVHRPQCVVCDEPTSFLDHHTGIKIMELLQHLVQKDKITLIVVTHDPRIVQFADKIDYVEDGRIIDHPDE